MVIGLTSFYVRIRVKNELGLDVHWEVIEGNNVGFILNTIDQFNEEVVTQALRINREYINQLGAKVFGFETILRQYESLYNQFFKDTEKQTETYNGVYEETF